MTSAPGGDPPGAEAVYYYLYLLAVPRTIFFIFRFAEPRGTVRFALGAAFLRAVRFAFLRSSLLSDFVFAIEFQSEWDVIGIAITIVTAAALVTAPR